MIRRLTGLGHISDSPANSRTNSLHRSRGRCNLALAVAREKDWSSIRMRCVFFLLMSVTAVLAQAATGNQLPEGVNSGKTPAGTVEMSGTDRCVANQAPAPGALPSPAGHFLVGTARTGTAPIAAARLVNPPASNTAERSGLARGRLQGALRLADAAPGTLQSTHIRLQI
jgi:hypothetical protein